MTQTLLAITKVPNYIYGKQLIIELYETFYGIHNHTVNTNEFASIAYNHSEEYLEDGLFENYVSIFVHKEIYKKLGMGFTDFISQPRYKINSILKIIDELDKKRLKTNEDMLSELGGKAKP